MKETESTQHSPEELNAMIAAVLAADGVQQGDIGRTMSNVSQSTVSRWLSRAKKEGWLIEKREHRLSQSQLEMVNQHLYPNYPVLRAKLTGIQNETLRELDFEERDLNLRVVFAQKKENTTQSPDVKGFGRSAARRIDELIKAKRQGNGMKMRIVAVAWGNTLSGLSRGLKDLYGENCPRKKNPIDFIPVCGEPLDYAITDISSSTLVSRLDEVVNGGTGKRRSLGSTPARIPKGFTKAEQRAIRKFSEQSLAYNEIFTGDDALIKKMDSVLTTVGGVDTSQPDPWLKVACRLEGMELEELERFTIGDIAGVFIPKPETAGSREDPIVGLNGRSAGVSLDQFRVCARRAAENENPGVILIAAGRRKSRIVKEAVRMGLVNELIIDHDLADGILG